MSSNPKGKLIQKEVEGDILVIGGGIGGFSAAISAKESKHLEKVILVEKSYASRTGPSAFVGGIYVGILPEDDPNEVLKNLTDSFSYGGPLSDQTSFEMLINNGPRTIENLERWGVKFVKLPDGKYVRVFQRGFQTMRLEGGGLPMMKALREYAVRLHVDIFDWVTITDLLVSDGIVAGAVGISSKTGEFFIFKSKTTVLATGGTVFKSRQPGHRQLSGDGWAMAYRAGAEIAGMDIDMPNVYGATLEIGPGNGLYLSQGGRLLNNKMEEYIKNYPELERLKDPETHTPLMAIEARRGNAPPVWLDLRHFTPDQVEMIYGSVPYAALRWEKLGFLKDRKFVKLCEYAPEGPRAMGGGLLLDPVSFESRNLRDLFGCGEAATHFQTSLGLNTAAISGIIAGNSAAERASKTGEKAVDSKQVVELRKAAISPIERRDGVEPEYCLTMLQEALHPYYVYILRSEKNLRKALGEIEAIRDDLLPVLHAYDPHYLRLASDIRNMVLCAEMFLRAALERKESRYGALREDYPYMDNINWLKWIVIKKNLTTGQMELRSEDIPMEKYKFKQKREKVLHPFWARVEELGFWKRPLEESRWE